MENIENNLTESTEVERANLNERWALIPSWLPLFIRNTYFDPCPKHAAIGKGECNIFCLVCNEAQCSFCMKLDHKKHQFIQVRRTSYSDSVRLDDMREYIDVSNIQIYHINKSCIIFLNERYNSKPAKGSAPRCQICSKSMIVPFKFCSIRCKLEGVKQGYEGVTFELPNVINNNKMENSFISKWIRLPLSPPPLPTPTPPPTTIIGDENSKSSEQACGSDLPPPSPIKIACGHQGRSRSRILKRKGIPRRAPFF